MPDARSDRFADWLGQQVRIYPNTNLGFENNADARPAPTNNPESCEKSRVLGAFRVFSRTAADAIIAEERAKHHDVLADRLTHLTQSNGAG